MERLIPEPWGFQNYYERNELGQTALHIAILKELGIESIEKILKFGSKVEVNVKDKFGNTPLHLALFPPPGNVELVKMLLKHGVSVDEKNIHGQTPLHTVIKYNMNLQIVEELLEYGADANAKDMFGMTPLQIAVENSTENLEIIKKLLSAGASVLVKNDLEETTLHIAIKNQKNLEMIQLLSCGGNINFKDKKHMTPLHIACNSLTTTLDLIEYLISSGASVNKKNIEHQTPLHIALERGKSLEIIQHLTYEAKMNAKDIYGMTPLHIACRTTRLDLIKYLISCGAFVHERNSDLQTPLHLALQNDLTLTIIEELLNCGAKVNLKDRKGMSPLFIALHSSLRNVEKIKTLLQHGASVLQKFKGQTPLHVAIRKGKCLEIVQELLKYGAEINVRDSFGVPPLYIALNNSPVDFNTVKLLLKYGASVHEKDTLCRITVRLFGQDNLVRQMPKEILRYALTEHPDNIHCTFCSTLCKNCTKYRSYVVELNKMKNISVVGKLTLYDFLVYKFDYGKMFSKDQDVLSNFYFLRHIKTEFPKYQDIILNSLRTKDYLLIKFCDLLVFAQSDQHNIIYLNSDCLREIGSYLSKDDMKNFLKASILQ